jgi:hypothetical protein
MVPRPETPPAPIRGRTTQNWVSSRSSGIANFSSCATTSTLSRSSPRPTLSTSPTSTLRALILVLPASIPSAVLKTIVILGPWVANVK